MGPRLKALGEHWYLTRFHSIVKFSLFSFIVYCHCYFLFMASESAFLFMVESHSFLFKQVYVSFKKLHKYSNNSDGTEIKQNSRGR